MKKTRFIGKHSLLLIIVITLWCHSLDEVHGSSRLVSEENLRLFGENNVDKRTYSVREANIWPDFFLQGFDKANRYDSMTSFIFGLKYKYPDIVGIESIGQSTEGRQIWAIKLSLGASSPTKPNVRYEAGLNGNDMVGRELILQLLEEICLGHGQNSTFVNSLLTHTNIYLLPMLNPDAVAATTEHQCWNRLARYYNNANNISLSDNMENLIKLENDKQLLLKSNSTTGQLWANWRKFALQPEVLAYKNFILRHQFVLSLHLEGGGIGSQYAGKYRVDQKGQVSADAKIFESLVYYYWRHYEPEGGSFECPPEIIPWEEVPSSGALEAPNHKLSSLLDYNYIHTGCHSILLQVDCCAYTGSLRGLRQLYRRNRRSLLLYIVMAHQGVKGQITSAEDGQPIVEARLSLVNYNGEKFTTNSNGVFWRILLPGDYTMQVATEGFLPTEVQFHVKDEGPTTLSFALEQGTLGAKGGGDGGAKYPKSTARNINVNVLNDLRIGFRDARPLDDSGVFK